jgi:hypothetical protein
MQTAHRLTKRRLQDVLYLMIVRRPTEEEMAQAVAAHEAKMQRRHTGEL